MCTYVVDGLIRVVWTGPSDDTTRVLMPDGLRTYVYEPFTTLFRLILS